MSDGVWAVVGAVVGIVGSTATTWLNAYLKRKSAFPEYDTAVGALLTDMLQNGPNWRKLDELGNVVGLKEKATKEYLIVLGARGTSTMVRFGG